MGDRLDVLPGSKHVEDDAVDAAFLGCPQHLVDVTDAQVPRGVSPTEPQVNVGSGNVCEILAAFDGDEASLRPDGIEQSHRERTRTCAGLDDSRAGEDVTHVGDDARIFGVHDGGTAGHRHDVVDLERTQNLELSALLRDDDLAVRAADDVVVVESAAVGLEATAFHQDHLVESSLGVANLNAGALGEGASAGGLAKIGGLYGCITLNRHYVNDTACSQLRPRQDTDEGARG